VSALVFLLLAAAAGVGLYRTMRVRAENIRYLERADDEPMLVSHLPRALQRLAHETRALRLSLEDPARQLGAGRGRLSTDADVHAIDHQLMNSSRDVGEWLAGIGRLSPEDRERLVDLGANVGAVRDTFAAAGFSFELGGGGARRARTILAQLEDLRRALQRVESALQIQGNPYR
jgi:hypothetical protein